MSHGHGAAHGDGDNKYIAIFISLLALMLALAETFAKGAQTNSISYNVEASNLWSFYQAKTIRQTTLKTAAEQMEIDAQLTRDPATKAVLDKRIGSWKAEVERYQSEPKADGKGEGRRELQQRAIEAGKKRDLYMEKYHHYEVGSAAFQIAIVLAGTYILVQNAIMLWLAGGLAAVGVFFTFIGFFFPSAIHLF